MKKIVLAVVGMMTVFGLFGEPLQDGGPYKETVDGIEWTFMVTGGEASLGDPCWGVSTSDPLSGDVVVPSVLGGRKVTQIGEEAFEQCYEVLSITIPLGIRNIGNGAFIDCGMKSVTLPSSLTNIGEMAFAYCHSLRKVLIPDGGKDDWRSGVSRVCRS